MTYCGLIANNRLRGYEAESEHQEAASVSINVV
jgi:hypothetical protein